MYLQRIDVDVGATKGLNIYKLADNEKMAFQIQCLTFLLTLATKIVEKSLLKYDLVRALSSFVPSVVASNPVTAEYRMKKLVEILFDSDHNYLYADCRHHNNFQYFV